MTPPRTGRDTTPLACRAPVNLTVDHLSSPIGVAVPRPVLAWQVPGPAPARAYEIEVRRLDPAGAAAPEPAWATGRVEIASPPMSPWVAYDGAPLVSDADYSWRVRVWTADAGPSDWAASAFSTSLLRPDSDAVAPWVEPAQTPAEPEPPIDFAAVFGENGGQRTWEPAGRRLHPVKLVRQELAPTAPAASDAAEPGDAPPAALTRARLYTTAQGVLDVSIDGAPVGDSVLAPGWTSYHDYTEFDVHDVTAALASPGPHVLGLRLADGWFAGRIGALGESAQYGRVLRAWWQLSLTYADGSTAVVGPDATARSTEDGPIRYSDILVGERRDLANAVLGDDNCKVQAGALSDPYTGQRIAFKRGANSSGAVQIDHVVALSNAWQTGAQQLSSEQRISLANDPLELLAVDGPANQQKGDGDAATWLPSNKPFRCQYIARQIAVKKKYSLWVTPPERTAMERILASCPEQRLPA